MIKTTSTDIDMSSPLSMLNSVSDLDDLCIGKVIFPTCILEFDCRGKQFRRKEFPILLMIEVNS